MKDEDLVLERESPTRDPSILFSKPYNMLLLPTKQLGKSATSAFMSVGSVLASSALSPFEKLLKLQADEESEKRKKKERLTKEISRANEVLTSATAVFPFDLFPDTITVDRTKITITKRSFFWTAQVISIRIEDILNVTTSVGPFFGSLNVSSRVMNSIDQFSTTYFWRKDAIRLKHIVQGYVIALHNKIDIDNLTKDELLETLSELGHDATA